MRVPGFTPPLSDPTPESGALRAGGPFGEATLLMTYSHEGKQGAQCMMHS